MPAKPIRKIGKRLARISERFYDKSLTGRRVIDVTSQKKYAKALIHTAIKDDKIKQITLNTRLMPDQKAEQIRKYLLGQNARGENSVSREKALERANKLLENIVACENYAISLEMPKLRTEAKRLRLDKKQTKEFINDATHKKQRLLMIARVPIEFARAAISRNTTVEDMRTIITMLEAEKEKPSK